MRKSALLLASFTTVSLLLGGCQSSLTGDSYSRDEARRVQTVRMGTIESLRPVKIEGTKTPIGGGAGAIVGSGTVSNYDRSRGASCLAERRMLEQIESGRPSTPFLRFGDRVSIEMRSADGHNIFGTLDNRVVRAGG